MLPASLSARWLPRDIVESTAAGGAFTLVAYLLMLVIFSLELYNFLSAPPSSVLSLQEDVQPHMRINFDIDLYDIECRNLQVMVVDALCGDAVPSVSRDFVLRSIDLQGRDRGIHRRVAGSADLDDEGLHQELATKLEKEDSKEELDADWASSHDGFKHQHFDHVIQYHDFTLVNFFAGWCSHCQRFAPVWAQLAEKINNQQFTDAVGKGRVVRAVKMNCVDFKGLCRTNGIDEFPTIRLYKSDGSYSRFEGRRDPGAIVAWVEKGVKAGTWTKNHEDLETGCNVHGHVHVPPVPGYLEFFAGGGQHDLEPSMTNVSHFVRHFSFASPNGYRRRRAQWANQLTHTKPLDGSRFTMEEFHQTYEHHLRVVSTYTLSGLVYQFQHYGRLASTSNKSQVPQAQFHYDLEPFAIAMHREETPWYTFATSVFALVGGAFVVMRLCAFSSRTAAKMAARSLRVGSTISRSQLDSPQQ